MPNNSKVGMSFIIEANNAEKDQIIIDMKQKAEGYLLKKLLIKLNIKKV